MYLYIAQILDFPDWHQATYDTLSLITEYFCSAEPFFIKIERFLQVKLIQQSGLKKTGPKLLAKWQCEV